MKFIKNNFLLILFLILGIFVAFKVYNLSNQIIMNEKETLDQVAEICEQGKDDPEISNSEACLDYFDDGFKTETTNFYYKLDNHLVFELRPFNLLAPLVLIIMSLFGVVNIFKERSAILMLKREKYSTFLRKLFIKIYRYVWFWPLIMLIIITLFSHNATFDLENLSEMYYGETLMRNAPLFIFLYLLNILIFSSFYINIALIIMRKQHNYALAVIESFLLIIAIELFLEIIIGNILFGLILNDVQTGLVFNISNAFTFNITEYSHGVISLFTFNISCFIISSIVVYFMYRNKEQLVIDCEKNN